jgi:MarR family transcriptional regulator, organic hydroperoxide resistance regulator
MNASKLRLYHRLQVAAHSVRKAADRIVLDAAGVTTAQSAVLTIAAGGPNVTQREVAAALHLNDSAVTAMVSRLLKLGLLERKPSIIDSRAWCLLLTSAGHEALESSRQSFKSINARMESKLSEIEIEQLAGLLDRLTEAFEEQA